MKSNIDFYFLKRPLIFFVIAIIISAAMIIFGLQYEQLHFENYQKGERTLRTTHKLYKNMVNDIDLLELYTAKYNAYKSSGLVGGERRLSWIESLKSANAVIKLPKLTYSLLPQNGFERPGLKVNKNTKVTSSPMELSMSLLHEEDLFALIEGLSLSISNLFTIDSCKITLQGIIGSQLDTKGSNLNADCVLRWISVDNK